MFVCERVKGLAFVGGGGVRKAFILDQIRNCELFHCGIERVVFHILRESY
jgi:hypothetical protein